MDTYPHVFFTSPDEWDPSVLDHDPPHLDGLDPSQVPDQPFGDPMFDAYGDFNERIIANLNTLSDNIRKRGAMDTLISDGGKYEISKRVIDLLFPLFIQDYQSEPYHQHPNLAENRFELAKRYTNTVMNTSGCPACCWLLCLQYICVVLNHLASPTLQGI